MSSLGVTDIARQNLLEELTLFVARSQPQMVRTISQWVEDELILPSGPFKGERYRHRRHPASRLWFTALAANAWNRFAASGPTQNGKTLMCYVAPIMYHLFELQETVIIGLPTMQMAQDKWAEDLLLAIEASRYRELLPTSGEGSRGGQVKRAIRFRNDVSMRFMTAGGGDKQRAGYTSRVLAVTETDGMDESGETSREADAIEQLEGRTRAYGADKRVYLECTASIERGRIWQEITRGTDSRIYRPCPFCGEYVAPEREHLVGWQEAESELEAAEKACWQCPSCNHPWTEDDRRAGWAAAVLVHRGQKALAGGEVVGDPPRTRTLGFRWSAIDNPFAATAELGAEEWRSQRSADLENAEKKMRQFVWCWPYDPPEVELTPLAAEDVQQRIRGLKKGVAPPDCCGAAIGIDTGKRVLHWTALAMSTGGAGAIIDYGQQPVDSERLGVLKGLVEALLQLRQYFAAGWRNESGQLWTPSQVWIDSGYHEHTDAVYEFCRQSNQGLARGAEIYRPAKGYGEGQVRMARYLAPKSLGSEVRYIGREFHLSWIRRARILLVHVNADHWKSDLHQRLAMPPEEPTAITLYQGASPAEHLAFSQQITAERQVEKWIPGRGTAPVWERVARANHYLDASYLATAAGQFVVTKLGEIQRKATRPAGGGVRKAPVDATDKTDQWVSY